MIFCRLGSVDCDCSPFFRFWESGEGALEGKATGEDINGILGVGGEDGNESSSRIGEHRLRSREFFGGRVGVSAEV
jgi:hypothetical protein